MRKRSFCIICALLITVCFLLSACNSSGGDYPVNVGHSVFSQSPEKVVCLSDNLADIIMYSGYSSKLGGISDECTQKDMQKYITSVGSRTNPNTKLIISSNASAVIIDTQLDTVVEKELKENNIEIIHLLYPKNTEQLKTVYETLGKIFDGNTTGASKGIASYERLLSILSSAESEIMSKAKNTTLCYLFLDKDGKLCAFTGKVDDGMVLEYVGATNVAANFKDGKVDANVLKLANPEYIFFDDEAVLTKLQSDKTLKNLSAVKSGKTYELAKEELTRQGQSLIDTQNYILSVMFPDMVTTPVAPSEDISALYGISLTEDMYYKAGDDNENIVAVQERLIDLGYLVLAEGDTATTYFGSMSEEAVKAFQKANGLEESGAASYETLKKLFSSDAVGANGNTYVPETQATAPETEPAPTETTASAGENNTPQSGTSEPPFEITADSFYQKGTYHDDVIEIQKRLIELGFLTLAEGDEATTFYGEQTEASVKAFQKANGLEESGVADEETLNKLFSSSAVSG